MLRTRAKSMRSGASDWRLETPSVDEVVVPTIRESIAQVGTADEQVDRVATLGSGADDARPAHGPIHELLQCPAGSLRCRVRCGLMGHETHWDRLLGSAIGIGCWDRLLGSANRADHWARFVGSASRLFAPGHRIGIRVRGAVIVVVRGAAVRSEKRLYALPEHAGRDRNARDGRDHSLKEQASGTGIDIGLGGRRKRQTYNHHRKHRTYPAPSRPWERLKVHMCTSKEQRLGQVDPYVALGARVVERHAVETVQLQTEKPMNGRHHVGELYDVTRYLEGFFGSSGLFEQQ